jgi:hypothetical protein
MKASTELIVHSAAGHPLESSIDDGADLIGWLVVPAM